MQITTDRERWQRRHILAGVFGMWLVWLGAGAVFYLGVLPRAMVQRAEDAVRAIPYVHEVDSE